MSRRDFCGFTLTKKEIESICLCIFINKFLVCWVFAVNCISQDWRSFDCSYLYQLFELIHQDCLGLLGHLLTFFFANQRIPSGGNSVPGGKIRSSSQTNPPFGPPFSSPAAKKYFTFFEESLIFQANRSWIGGLTLCVNRLFVDCMDRSLSSQPGHFAIQTWNNF